MKSLKSLLLLYSIIVMTLLFSCFNQPKSNQKETNKYDSTYWANEKIKAIKRADSIFTRFMGLKWYSSKKEAKKYFNSSKDLKIKFIADDEIIYLSGSYAGSQVKSMSLTYYDDKLCDAFIDFGYKSDVFYDTLKESLENKYGKPFKLEKGCVWDFDISSSEKNKPKIILQTDNEGLSLLYISKYCDQYKEEVNLSKSSKEKETLKLKQKNL